MTSSALLKGAGLLLAAASPALAANAPPAGTGWYPTVKSYSALGTLDDGGVTRDSCGSARFGDRTLWTCRDTQPVSNGQPILPVWSSSASWTNYDFTGTPMLGTYGTNQGSPYYPYAGDECPNNSAGGCDDGSRYAIWPAQPPLVTSTNGNIVTAYTWIPKAHIKGLTPIDKDPATSLYKIVYDTSTQDRNALPQPQLLSEEFWPANSIPFGSYGTVVKDGTAYLFGMPSNGQNCLAKVSTDSVENQSAYQYYVNGAWTSSKPAIGDNCKLDAGAGGQGTYYFSYYWNKWVWIGQGALSVSADFYVATADNIEGPWDPPQFFYRGANGNQALGAYTLQAHPDLSALGYADANEIFISWTKSDTLYSTPIVRIDWN